MDKKDLVIYGCMGLVAHHGHLEHHETLAGLEVPRVVGYVPQRPALMQHGNESTHSSSASATAIMVVVATSTRPTFDLAGGPLTWPRLT